MYVCIIIRARNDCSKNTIFYEISSVDKCTINDISNPWYGLYQGSSAYVCDNSQSNSNGVPMLEGYLGTHCSYTSLSTTLPTICTPKPYYDSNPYYSYITYMCTPPTVGTGTDYQTWYYTIDCKYLYFMYRHIIIVFKYYFDVLLLFLLFNILFMIVAVCR